MSRVTCVARTIGLVGQRPAVRRRADEYARIASPTAGDLHHQACCLALAGNQDAAIERLRAALDLGFQDSAGAAADTDLASLRDDPRWPFAKQP